MRNPFKQCPGRQNEALFNSLLGVGQDTISRLEQRSDMLLSTLRRYIEGMGGKLELVAQFPNRPPVVIDHLAEEKTSPRSATRAHRAARTAT
ncbi:helix-turn-helix domain-containing protein [Burkholderia pseudomallei]|uniref:helix-turn-helix domain-containing protein n=1 Tax=Burkholderia pseudomallei TaxID=28450 RepID=UPI0009B2599E|nr:transcriptional regulator [Burkholderia pseudomallei]